MNNVLKELEPKLVFDYFEKISQIPRCSGNEKAISDFLVNFAKERNLEVIQDKTLNVIIRKPGTLGYENAPIVILQGHIDIVCEKNKETVHDFSKDPIKLRIDEDMIKATGTTLGADNGIAVAYSLALLDSKDIQHPPLEVVFTTEEETGMDGVMGLDPDNLEGKILINIDSEEEGIFYVSCAGGARNRVELPVKREKIKENLKSYHIKIRGLKGGHSGSEIDKGRGNSNKLMGCILNDLNDVIEFYLSDISGGSKTNAIPRESDVIISINSEDKGQLKQIIRYWNEAFKRELKASDPDVRVEIERVRGIEEVFSKEVTGKVIAILMLMPNGLQTMSMEIEGLVQSSTNLGVVTTSKDHITFDSAVRSSVAMLKQRILEQIGMIAKVLDIESITEADYPAWEYKEDSYIRDIFTKVYKDFTGKEAEIAAIHAGLECGFFDEKLEDVDMISFGPNMYDVHTPDERLDISSTKRTWEFFLEVLKNIK